LSPGRESGEETRSRPSGLFLEDRGSGAVVVLLHSFLCSGEMWRHQAAALAERYRVINLDLPGHGRSAPIDRPVSLYELVDVVIGELDARGIDRAVWCGLSIGGMIALRAALERPERVAAIALLDTDAGAERVLKRLKHSMLAAGTRRLGLRPFVPIVARLMFGRTSLRRRPELVAEWRERFASVHLPSMLRYVDALNRRDALEQWLSGIEQPALVLVGAEDRSLPPRCSEAICCRLPSAEYHVIAGAGHLSALECPEAVTAALLGFLDRVVQPTG
jgi:pimeloyl-ACP methyl ester carboxylesterase